MKKKMGKNNNIFSAVFYNTLNLFDISDYSLLKTTNYKLKTTQAFSLVEVILAVALFGVFSFGAVGIVAQGLEANRLGSEQTIAKEYAAEGLEAARSIKNQSFASLANSAGTGITKSGTSWAFTGVNNVFESRYTRTIAVADVYRDGSGNIVASGGTFDANCKNITSTVSWTVSGVRNNSVTLSTYLSNWSAAIGPPPEPTCDWVTATSLGGFQYPTNQDGMKVRIQGNYAYVILSDAGNNPYDFAIMDMTDPAAPAIKGTLQLAGTLSNLFVSGDYAYLASSDNSNEFIIVNISDPDAPAIADTVNLTGNHDAKGVYVIGNYAYVVRVGNNSQGEFFVMNITDPNNSSVEGSTDLGRNNQGGNDIYVAGNYAYIASQDSSSELKVVDITNPAAPNYLPNSKYDISGNNQAYAVVGLDNILLLGGQDGNLYILDIADPTAISQSSLISTFDIGDVINDIEYGNGNLNAFVSSNANVNAELQIINLSVPATPTLQTDLQFDLPLNGLALDTVNCRVIAVGSSNQGNQLDVIGGNQ